MTEYSYMVTHNALGEYQSYAGRPAVIRSKKCERNNKEDVDYIDLARSFAQDEAPYMGFDRFWFENGLKHNEGGPAVICTIGTGKVRYYINGKKHREGGGDTEPAYINHITDEDWELRWYTKGKLDRKDGPAVIRSDGIIKYYKEGKLRKHEENFGLKENSEKKYDEYFELLVSLMEDANYENTMKKDYN